MNQSLNNKINLKTKLISIFNLNKIKIFILFILIILSFFSFFLFKEYKKKENIQLSEKYIKADIFLANGDSKKAKKILEEVVVSGNNFYAILALNTLVEKNLINDKNKIIELFMKIEDQKTSDEIADLILLKKALYLMKFNKDNSGKEILNNLINNDSKIKDLAQEIISK